MRYSHRATGVNVATRLRKSGRVARRPAERLCWDARARHSARTGQSVGLFLVFGGNGMTDLTKMLGTSQAAKALGVSEPRVRQMLASGEWPAVKTVLGHLIAPEAVADVA